MSKLLIVDDQDRSIQYSGSWSSENHVGDFTNEYLNTVHKSSNVGDSLEYSFVGTSISVFGTLNTPRSLGLPTPRFGIDDNDATAFNSSGDVLNWDRGVQTSHALLYKSPTLPKGNHTIKINIASPSGTSTTPGPFYLDYFTVDSGSDSVAGDVILDDRDQSLLFSGSWGNTGIAQEYMGTTRASPDTANGGTMTFQFNGTAITVFGTTAETLTQGTTKILFSIDGQSTTFEGKGGLGAVLHQALFQATSLGADKTHTLTITPQNGNHFFLDYFVYRTTNSSTISPGGGGSNDNKSSNTGAIVGGVVGAVVIVGLAILGFFLWRRRTRKTAKEAEGSAFHPGVTEPYHVPNGSQYTAVPFGSMSNVPASKNMPHNRASEVQSSFYDGDGNSTAYTGVDTHFTASDFRPPGSEVSAGSGANVNGRYVPGGTILYPQFEGVHSRAPPPRSSPVPPSATYPPIPGPTYVQSHSEKSRFLNMDRHPSPPSSSHVPHTAYPPDSSIVSSSPPMSSELDSGVRIPRVSPPVYTED